MLYWHIIHYIYNINYIFLESIMDVVEKYHWQYKGALSVLWIDDIELGQISEGKHFINLWSMSWENMSLAAALDKVAQDVSICMCHMLNDWWYKFKKNEFTPIEKPYPVATFAMREDFAAIIHGNSEGFKKYSESKYFSHFILWKNGVPQPKQIMFREITKASYCQRSVDARYERLLRFLDNLWPDTEVVLKPISGSWGKDVFFYTTEEIRKLREYICFDPEYVFEWDIPVDKPWNEFLRFAIVFWDYVIQERIPSYPIEVWWEKKDWNLRVLTTYCPDKKEYIVAGIAGRIDQDGWPVNRSITADNISLDEIAKLAGWDEDQFRTIVTRTKELAVKVTSIFSSIWNRKDEQGVTPDFQCLAGIDIIIWKDWKPSVIEVNDSNSGCVYELLLLEGIESILPIAISVDYKISYSMALLELMNSMKDELSVEEFDTLFDRVKNGEDPRIVMKELKPPSISLQ